MSRKESVVMECKRALELIVPFINEQLNPEDVEAFLNHIDDWK